VGLLRAGLTALLRRVRDAQGPLWPQPGVGLVTAAVAALALWATATGRGGWLPGPGRGLPLPALCLALGLASAVVVAYQYPIHVRHQTKVSLATVVYYLLAVLVPPPLATAATGLGALAGELSRRGSSGAYASDIATEAGRRVLMVLPAALLAQAGGGAAGRPLAVIGAALLLAALDALTLPLVLAPMSGERPRHALVSVARETLPVEGVQYAIGLLGALAALHYPWAVVVLVVPAALVYAACKVLREMHDGTRQLLENMADAVDLRDPYTGGHSRRVTAYSAAILRELGLHGPEVDLIVTAARVHDIGKIGTPDAVLHKPGKLDPDERAIMEKHPVQGAEVLKRYRDFARGVALVRHHHESWDGTGYPDRLAGMEIPFGARVIAVADSFDAMTSDRPYRRGMPIEKAAAILRAGRGVQWDGALVDAFLRTQEMVPGETVPAPLVTSTPSATDARVTAHPGHVSGSPGTGERERSVVQTGPVWAARASHTEVRERVPAESVP